ncbi:hypothetical protein L798_07427 [Zootermopsis nevadensis]|uniref:Uncharacterized protein n=1 Tax=Zootermopsis nevadensis TaxID=136037 RepID=A0A067QEN4_ZOONE|nr:hypothetical protein L798_07427 [Zootermopsis nevadensis]
MSSQSLHVILEFGGGAELLFNRVKKHDVILPALEEPCKF